MAVNNDRPVKVTCSVCSDTFWADPRDWQALVDHKHKRPERNWEDYVDEGGYG